MNGDTQRNVLNRLHFALSPRGVLFLGHAEMMLSQGDRFTPVSLSSRIFRKAIGTHAAAGQFDPSAAIVRQGDLNGLDPIRELAFRASPVAQIVVTGEDTVAMINQQAETTFGLSARDIGRLLRDLEVSYRPVELRSYLEQAKVERRPARIQDVKWIRPGADTTWYEVHINPLVDSDNGILGVSVVFFDVTSNRALLDKVVQTNHQLEAAYEELQSTNEELETTNEELQSTVEELETTNEELQSTNEELETINEELQSTNDELHTINDTLRDRSVELDEARTFLTSLANSLRSGLVVVDREMKVVVWNRAAEELWGLRSDETIGAAFTSLDMGLPLDGIRPLIGNALVDPESFGETEVAAVNRRGRQALVRVTCTPFLAGDSVSGAMLLMDAQG
jgi:two-component system, chemotaxis family, CheB/CheR fusion protein